MQVMVEWVRVVTDLVYSVIEYVAIRVSNASSFSIHHTTTTLSAEPLSRSQVNYFPPEHEKQFEVRDCGIL